MPKCSMAVYMIGCGSARMAAPMPGCSMTIEGRLAHPCQAVKAMFTLSDLNVPFRRL